MSTESPHPATRAITLTDRPPVRIAVAEWPTIAQGYLTHDGAELMVRVRRHGDGRVIVYGAHRAPGVLIRDGRLLDTPPTDRALVSAIAAVTARLRAASDDDRWAEVNRQCIASLPAEVL